MDLEAHIILCPGGWDAGAELERYGARYRNIRLTVCETREALEAELARIAREAAYFMVSTRQGKCILDRNDIMYCRADGHRFAVYLSDGRTLTSLTTRRAFAHSMAPLLRDSRFAQCSASAVVNWNYVCCCRDSKLILKDRTEIPFPAKWHARTLAAAGLDANGWLAGE